MNTEHPTSDQRVNTDWYQLNSRGYILNSEQTEQPEVNSEYYADRWLRWSEQQKMNSEQTEHYTTEPIEQIAFAVHSMAEHLALNSKQTEQQEELNSALNTEQPGMNSTVHLHALTEQISQDIDAIHSLCYSAIQSPDPRPYLVKIMNILEGVRE